MAFGPETVEHRDQMRQVFLAGTKALTEEVTNRAYRSITLEWAINGDPAPSDNEMAVITDTVTTTLAAFIDLMGEAGLVVVPRENIPQRAHNHDDEDDWDV